MSRSLKRMNYPQQFVDFIKILYQETYSQVQNNGHMSEEFLLERGVRQGNPLSFPLYCVQNDLFSYDILKDKEINGFNIPAGKKTLNYPNTQMTLVLFRPTLSTYIYFLISFQNTKRLQDAALMPIKQKVY